VKLSDALLQFAGPLVSLLPPDASAEDLEAMLSLAYLVWNGVVLEELGRESPYLAEAKSVVRGRMPIAGRKEVLRLIAAMESRKRAENPPDLRVIGEFSLRPVQGGLNLFASQVPPPPEKTPPTGTWGQLYAEAIRLLSLAPWHKMGDAHLFGVRDPATGEVGWCCVMGSGGTLFGLAVYRGDVGFDFHRRVQRDELSEEDALYGQDALTLVFSDRAELTKQELRRLREHGLSFRGPGRWPMFQSHESGSLPVEFNDVEAERMLHTLREAIRLIVDKRDESEWAKPDARGRILVRTLRDGAWVDERVRTPSPIERSVPQFNSVRAEGLKRSLPQKSLELECDLQPMRTVIKEKKGRGYMPAHFVLANRASGEVVHHMLGPPNEREKMAQEELLTGLERLGSRPTALVVRRASVKRVLAPVAEALGIAVRIVDDLPQVDGLCDFLDQMMDGTDGPGPKRPPRR